MPPRDDSSPSERLRTALGLFELSVRMMRQKVRRSDPTASEASIDERIQEWLSRRPGAPVADAEGRAGRWPREER